MWPWRQVPNALFSMHSFLSRVFPPTHIRVAHSLTPLVLWEGLFTSNLHDQTNDWIVVEIYLHASHLAISEVFRISFIWEWIIAEVCWVRCKHYILRWHFQWRTELFSRIKYCLEYTAMLEVFALKTELEWMASSLLLWSWLNAGQNTFEKTKFNTKYFCFV